ncbi:MAG: DUF6512 family protein [Eubacteriales bacterium]
MNSGKKVIKVKVIGIVSIILLGFLFHELYKSTGIKVLSIIAPVNESKWEHWKMAYSPMIIVSIFEYPFIKNSTNNYIFALALGILAFEFVTFGLIEYFELFFGKAHLFVHITTYILGALAGQNFRYFLMKYTEPKKLLFTIGIFILIIHFSLFAVFTFNPPKVEYFKDSISGTYGL